MLSTLVTKVSKPLDQYEKTSVTQEQLAGKSIVQDLNQEAVYKEMKENEVDTDRVRTSES